MNIDSAVKGMNARLKELYSIFGSQSQEYQNARAAIFSNGIPAEFTKEEVNKPLQISRSKKALEGLSHLETDVANAKESMRGLGTVLQQARKYDPNITRKRLMGQQEREWLRKAALGRAVLSDAVDDFYMLIDEIDDSDEQLRIRRELQDTRGLRGDAHSAEVDRIADEVYDIIRKQGEEAYKYLTGKSMVVPGSDGETASNLRSFFRK